MTILNFKKDFVRLKTTYVMIPGQFVNLRIGTDVTFEVDIVSFFNISRVQGRPHPEEQHGGICKKIKI